LRYGSTEDDSQVRLESLIARRVISPVEAKELIRLIDKHEVAMKHTATIHRTHGLYSLEFLEANNASDDLWNQIREILGETERHWVM
jgi:hypothetical protein